jgi:hypothetical protein
MVTAEWLIAPLAAVTAELIATFGTALALYHDYITALFAVHLLFSSFFILIAYI